MLLCNKHPSIRQYSFSNNPCFHLCIPFQSFTWWAAAWRAMVRYGVIPFKLSYIYITNLGSFLFQEFAFSLEWWVPSLRTRRHIWTSHWFRDRYSIPWVVQSGHCYSTVMEIKVRVYMFLKLVLGLYPLVVVGFSFNSSEPQTSC